MSPALRVAGARMLKQEAALGLLSTLPAFGRGGEAPASSAEPGCRWDSGGVVRDAGGVPNPLPGSARVVGTGRGRHAVRRGRSAPRARRSTSSGPDGGDRRDRARHGWDDGDGLGRSSRPRTARSSSSGPCVFVRAPLRVGLSPVVRGRRGTVGIDREAPLVDGFRVTGTSSPWPLSSPATTGCRARSASSTSCRWSPTTRWRSIGWGSSRRQPALAAGLPRPGAVRGGDEQQPRDRHGGLRRDGRGDGQRPDGG